MHRQRFFAFLLMVLFTVRTLASEAQTIFPRPVEMELPKWPKTLDRKRGDGLVEVKVKVLSSGKVQSVETREVDGTGLAAMCERAAQNWKFRPVEYDGRRIDGVYLALIEFKGGKATAVKQSGIVKDGKRPRPISQVTPDYPVDDYKEAGNGRVLLSFIVGWDGTVGDIAVIESTHPAFLQPSIDALSRWKFEPATFKGRQISMQMAVPITFALSVENSPVDSSVTQGTP